MVFIQEESVWSWSWLCYNLYCVPISSRSRLRELLLRWNREARLRESGNSSFFRAGIVEDSWRAWTRFRIGFYSLLRLCRAWLLRLPSRLQPVSVACIAAFDCRSTIGFWAGMHFLSLALRSAYGIARDTTHIQLRKRNITNFIWSE